MSAATIMISQNTDPAARKVKEAFLNVLNPQTWCLAYRYVFIDYVH